MLLRTSQQIDKFVEVEDTSELDAATYQQLKGSVRTVVRLLNTGSLPQPSSAQFENMVRSVSQLSRQEIGDGLEVARKFCLKTFTDPELDEYLSQIPLAWRAEVKTLGQSLTNLGFALFNRDLIYDLKPLMLEVMEQKINDKEVLARFFSVLNQHLKKWVAARKLYIPKSSATNQTQPPRFIQQTFNQLTVIDSQQIQQLQAEINQLQAQVNSLKAQLKQNSPSSEQNNKQNEIKDTERQLNAKKKKLETIQQQSQEVLKENSTEAAHHYHFLPSNLELDKISKKLEQFDSKQQENKWTSGKIALVAVGCFLGGGLIVYLLYLAFHKKN